MSEKVKANPDYAASAVNLTNSQDLAIDLTAMHGLIAKIEAIQGEIESLVPGNSRTACNHSTRN